jgi:hypothetical protein
MVVFVDLDDESEPPEDPRLRAHWDIHGRAGVIRRFGVGNKEGKTDEGQRDNPNRTVVTEALGCYPYVYHISEIKQLHAFSLIWTR